MKDNIRDLTEAKTYLSKIAAKRFTWKDEGYEDIGFIAQDVEAAGLPEFVLETQDYDPNTGVTSDPVKTLDYGRMVSVLWQAVRELTEEVETLKSRLH
ncbi:tail fiber domain-containing protein [bacterium]|nr:tail fiber domain-containing protein [bacterium]